MVTLMPVAKALVPVNSAAAQAVSALNYDEFQSDAEIREILARQPHSLLRVTMAHCTLPPETAPADGSPEALELARREMQALVCSGLLRELPQLLWVYEITSPKRPHVPQFGVGGMAATREIRTETNPQGTIVRNEGIRPEKAEGRAQLLTAISADTGFVNLAVPDSDGRLLAHLEQYAAASSCDFEVTDEGRNRHRVWLVTEPAHQRQLQDLVASQPAAYVADGNHRSAAAASLGKAGFLTVFFPAARLGLEPYNRLLPLNGLSPEEFLTRIEARFGVSPAGSAPYRPARVHEVGLYLKQSPQWLKLLPQPGTFSPDDAAEAIDADIVQRQIITGILGITDARDKRINYVGGNKDAAYLQSRVEAGEYDLAISLAPVTMDQFIAVCEQNRFMPPKSTWFDPKIRTGFVIALADA